MQAIDTGDAEVMAALLNGPALLCGLEDKDRAALAAHQAHTHAPGLLRLRAALEKAYDVNDKTNLEAIEAFLTLFPQEPTNRIEAQSGASQALKNAITAG